MSAGTRARSDKQTGRARRRQSIRRSEVLSCEVLIFQCLFVI